MKAAWYEQMGRAGDVLVVGEMAIPAVGRNDVLVRVAVSGINPSDVKGRSGWGGRTAMTFPRIVPHNDGAGVIEAVGPDVSESRIGERVWIFEAQRGRAFGTAAEYVVVRDNQAVPLPRDITFEVGASLGVPAMTAHRALFADGPLHGKTVLVQGGAGSVGRSAIQLAKWGGATVLATVGRDDDMAEAAAAGAEAVVNFRAQDPAEFINAHTGAHPGRQGVDRIIEVAFEANLATDLAVLKQNGTIATYASGGPDSAPCVPFYRMMQAGTNLRFVYVYIMPEEAKADAVRDIGLALEAGLLRPNVGRVAPLSDVAAIHDGVDRGDLGHRGLLSPG